MAITKSQYIHSRPKFRAILTVIAFRHSVVPQKWARKILYFQVETCFGTF